MVSMNETLFIGFDPRETDAFAVARLSARRNLNRPVPIRGLVLSELREKGLYWRPTSQRDGRLWDDISGAAMSTEFAISRFLAPHLAGSGWALFMDADMLVRRSLDRIFQAADPSKAVIVVKHDYDDASGVKMDGQAQQPYARKNWSSVMLFNASHPANRALTVEMVNTLPGRDLHRFCWLDDADIGEMPVEWNWLVGHSPEAVDPSIVHFTLGVPSMAGHENDPYADEWRGQLARWAA